MVARRNGRGRVSPAVRAAARRMALGARAAERQFTRDVLAIVRGVHARVMRAVESTGRALTTDALRLDSAAGDIDAVMRSVVPQIGPKVARVHKKLTDSLERNYRANMSKVLPLSFGKLDPKVQQAARDARDASVKLVEDAARSYAQQVREIFEAPNLTHGRRWEDLRDDLLERADVSESRANLIARDQTLKLNGSINEARQRAAGVDSYTWSTSGDERVRDEHAELDGEVFSWLAPPPPGHPGQDFQCRCIAIPIIPDMDDA